MVKPRLEGSPKDRRDDLACRMAIYAMVDQMDRCIGSLVDDLRKKRNLIIPSSIPPTTEPVQNGTQRDSISSQIKIFFAPDRIDEMGNLAHSTHWLDGQCWKHAMATL